MRRQMSVLFAIVQTEFVGHMKPFNCISECYLFSLPATAVLVVTDNGTQ